MHLRHQWIGVLACDFVDLMVVHTKPGEDIFLGNQKNRARPAALGWLDNDLVQYFLDLSLFHILFSDGKLSGWGWGGIWDGVPRCQ